MFQRTVNANVKTGARTRQSVLLRQLFRKHPEFYSSFSQSGEISKGLEVGRAELSSNIRHIISSIDDRYAAQHGMDLFKPTNKTALTLTSLGANLTSLEDYKKFIDHLYFVFRESVGQRLDGNIPQSFKDVNDLRTMLQHGVDHGGPSKAAKKRKQLAAVFQGYSGSPSPDAVDPSAFTLIQVNILAALNVDLNNLSKSLI